MDHQGSDSKNLGHCFLFSQDTGLKINALRRGNGADAVNNQISDNDDYDNPGINPADGDHQNHGGIDNQFVRQRIQKLPHGGDQIVFAREIPVKKISNGGQHEQSGQNQTPERSWVGKQEKQKGHYADARQGNGVGQIENLSDFIHG